MTERDAEPAPHPAQSPPVPDAHKETIRLSRRVERLELTLRQLEDIRDTNARLLDRLRVDLATEQARSVDLLRNILPQRIIDRLNAGERRIADRHDNVAVVFGDLVGFTSIAARLPAGELVERLGGLFATFDTAADQCGVEKIKSIGDAYLAVAGLASTRTDDRPAAVRAAADLALAMIDAVESVGPPWELRVGVSVGSIASGVIGGRRFAFDVWGDAVNVASRLESTSEPGRIHVSEEVAEILADDFVLEPRGVLTLKGKGAVSTSFLISRRVAPLAVDVRAPLADASGASSRS